MGINMDAMSRSISGSASMILNRKDFQDPGHAFWKTHGYPKFADRLPTFLVDTPYPSLPPRQPRPHGCHRLNLPCRGPNHFGQVFEQAGTNPP